MVWVVVAAEASGVAVVARAPAVAEAESCSLHMQSLVKYLV